MRAKQRKVDWTILAVAVLAAVIAVGVVAVAAPESADTSRVVSVQRLPENLDQCTWDDSAGSDPSLMASLQQNDLFSALQQQQPAAQEISATDERSAPQNPATAAERIFDAGHVCESEDFSHAADVCDERAIWNFDGRIAIGPAERAAARR